MTNPTPAVFVATDCPECGPGAPGRVLETDRRYANDLTPPAWEPCETCAALARHKALDFGVTPQELLRRFLEQGQPDDVDPKNVHPTDAFYARLEGGE